MGNYGTPRRLQYYEALRCVYGGVYVEKLRFLK
jgi:hypothetical protein